MNQHPGADEESGAPPEPQQQQPPQPGSGEGSESALERMKGQERAKADTVPGENPEAA